LEECIHFQLLSDYPREIVTMHGTRSRTLAGHDAVLNGLVQRVNRLAGEGAASRSVMSDGYIPIAEAPPTYGDFVPQEPQTLQETSLSNSDVEALVLKLMLARGNLTGRDVMDHIKLPFVMIERAMREMRHDQLVVYRNSAPMNDYLYQLTDIGRERAKRLTEHCSYFGAAPVSLQDYIACVQAQSLTKQHPTRDDLRRAFDDLLISPDRLARLGPAINSGNGLFLYGAPGNGKTSIAERLTKCFGQIIWIPRALGIDGEIIRLFDPMNHEEISLERPAALYDQARIDQRWVRIRRPTIVAGGELTMDNLEVSRNTSTGISEAPLQLKSNCGVLVIDDFGRQRISIEQLLNRWIVPLEKRYDYLNLANGKKVQVPFDQLIVFSTNLEPRDLVNEAFLRRIPYKVEVHDPGEAEFRQLFAIVCEKLNIPYKQEPIDYLIERHYRAVGRPFRWCQPRDLLIQVRNHCFYQGIPAELANEHFDLAAETYFTML
jgi:hypothetical protein